MAEIEKMLPSFFYAFKDVEISTYPGIVENRAVCVCVSKDWL